VAVSAPLVLLVFCLPTLARFPNARQDGFVCVVHPAVSNFPIPVVRMLPHIFWGHD